LENTTGVGNVAMGGQALSFLTTGSNNIALGFNAGLNVETADNVICIGTEVLGAEVSNSCYIGNIWQQTGGSQAVYVNASGKLGLQVSSRRFKDEIKPMEQASEVIYRLKPVSFRYKPEIEPTGPLCFGLIAEEVEKLNPDLIVRGSDGQVNSVRYDAVNAMLLNEFLKEHNKVEEQQATVARLKSTVAQQQQHFAHQEQQIAALTSGLQKVSAQVEMIKATPQIVANK
jgi:trimeric autotransporter adhesin